MIDFFNPNVSPEVREQYLSDLEKFSFVRSSLSTPKQSASSSQPSATFSQSLAMEPYTEPKFTWIVSPIKGPHAERVVEFLNERNIPAGLCAGGYPAVKDEEQRTLAIEELSKM